MFTRTVRQGFIQIVAIVTRVEVNIPVGEGGGGDSHIKRTAMLVGKFQTNPKKVPIWVWLKQNFFPKRYQSETYRQTISSMNLIAIDIKLILDGVQIKCHWQLPWHP